MTAKTAAKGEAKMLIRKSGMTHRWYAFSSYQRLDDKTVFVTGKKWDVTEEVEQILASTKEPEAIHG